MRKFTLLISLLVTMVTTTMAQNYSLTAFDVTTDEANPVTYVIESRRPAWGHPDFFLDGVKIKMQQGETYAGATDEDKNKYLFYFTAGTDGRYYIHPYNAEDGYVLGVESVAANAEIVVVSKDATGKTPIEWSMGTLSNNGTERPYFYATIDGTTYCLQDDGSGNYLKLALEENKAFVSTAVNFGKCEPYSLFNELNTLFSSFEYQIAYRCLGNLEGQFVDGDNAYKNAYEAAEAEIGANNATAKTLEDLQTAYGNLEYTPLATGKYYTFKSVSAGKYLAPSSQGNAMNLQDAISVFKLTTETWMEMYTNGLWINAANHGRGGQWHNTNKFYRVSDDQFIIAATPTNVTNCVFLKDGENDKLASTDHLDNNREELYYWIIEEVAPAINISAVKYATFFAPVDVEIPADVTAYYITETNSTHAIFTELISRYIPANTGVVLYSESEVSVNPTIVDYDGSRAIGGNLLKGTTKRTLISKDAGKSYYVLGKDSEGNVGFYNAVNGTNENEFYNGAFKAYLEIETPTDANGAPAFYGFDFGEGTTGIDEITENRVQSTVIYDLTGRRVEKITEAGIYIVNGKKVLVK